MMARPVASPLRSGNHLTSVETGAIYPSPSPTPLTTPKKKKNSQILSRYVASAEPNSPKVKNPADRSPAFDGPYFSTTRPKIAAERPSTKMAILNASDVLVTDQPNVFSSGIFQAL